MDPLLREGIDRECRRHLAHKTPLARHLNVTHFVETVARGREQALLDLRTVKAEKAEVQDELEELYEWVSELEVRLGEWELHDGSPGPAQANLCEEVRQLRIMNVALKGLTEAQEERLRDYERGPMRQVGIQTDPFQAVDPLQELRQENARLEGLLRDTTSSLSAARARSSQLEDEVDSLERQIKASEDAHYSTRYKPPTSVDLSRVDHLLGELDRLAHNELISRNAVQFYDRRHEYIVGQLTNLEQDVDTRLLHARTWMKAREDEMLAMRRRQLDASCVDGNKARDDNARDDDEGPLRDCRRWTRHELPQFLGLPSDPLLSAGDRYSAPPVLVLLPNIDVSSVEHDVLFAFADLEKEITREAHTYRA
ncbi:hypothetical protein OC834_006452 [Tilletia horrida]|uniref:Uncharacterized protein n=1 Tax=Tilletia horrida TaxID=155126 RepID=A0AAN6JKV8_9BASI|nr:hypothetical protein OC834_006452 [Tilletia horrida]KAK0532399.1 hypothetical protein OC842_003309 [Tilletia horrida]